MDKLPLPEAIIFDLDGTLFQTETLLETVHRRIFQTLRDEGLYVQASPSLETFLGYLGMLLEDIWKKAMPQASSEVYGRANELMLQFELEELARGRGTLYPGVKETLAELRRRGIRLFIASNGLELYVKAVPDLRGIADSFEAVYSAGEYATTSKVHLVRRLLDDFGIRRAWMVGDRSSDVEAGKANDLTVVGCDYAGFGRKQELDGADAVIRSFPELLKLLPENPT